MDKRVEKILKQYLPDDMALKDAVWKHKQSGLYIASHKALEIVAAEAGVTYDNPQVLELNLDAKTCAVLVTGRLKEACEWSIGESATYNTNIGYPCSMAEKRGKDRVILKLLGIHGFIYSEEEIEESKKDKPNLSFSEPNAAPKNKEFAMKLSKKVEPRLKEATHVAQIDQIEAEFKDDIDKLNQTNRMVMDDIINNRRIELDAK
jgi:hypothetical protein